MKRNCNLQPETCKLTVEDEKRLGDIIVKWRESKKTESEVADCNNQLNAEAKEAIDLLVTSNMHLSKSYAVLYYKKYKGTLSLDIEDLEQSANIGLIKAAMNFSPDKGCRFSTYAIFWIEKCIRQEISDANDIIRKPCSVQKNIRRIYKCGLEKTDEIISETTGIKIDEIKFLKSLINIKYISIDENNDSEEHDKDNNLAECISDNYYFNDYIFKKIETDCLVECVLDIEDQNERIATMMYLGITSSRKSYSYSQISKITGMTVYNVQKAVKKSCAMVWNQINGE